uniref:ATP synthase F0 subunit 6 n=1 Tax=Euryhaliotrema johni TaxID=2849187 RepID=A0A8F2PSJ7_9PLAT|nr:ATP synthase F0 subunit 6 [Euryhaliotrema johni]
MVIINRISSAYFMAASLVSSLGFVYIFLCGTLLGAFLFLRIPYVYGLSGFMLFLFVIVGPLFGSLFAGRIESGVDDFLSSLVPPGTPLWIAPFVGLAETISYIVRPAVLMLRPFLNITIGVYGGAKLGEMFMVNNFLFILLLVLFLYEVFVAMVHWFIVVNILGFSVEH